eukprot:UN10102
MLSKFGKKRACVKHLQSAHKFPLYKQSQPKTKNI